MYVVLYIIYPHSDLEAFPSFLNKCLERIDKEKKFCIINELFQYNLIKYWLSCGYKWILRYPYIFLLTSTNLTAYWNNIPINYYLLVTSVFNSTEHQTISGNIFCDLTVHLPNFIINKVPTLNFNPILIWVYSCKWGWLDLPHSNSNLSISQSPSPKHHSPKNYQDL